MKIKTNVAGPENSQPVNLYDGDLEVFCNPNAEALLFSRNVVLQTRIEGSNQVILIQYINES